MANTKKPRKACTKTLEAAVPYVSMQSVVLEIITHRVPCKWVAEAPARILEGHGYTSIARRSESMQGAGRGLLEQPCYDSGMLHWLPLYRAQIGQRIKSGRRTGGQAFSVGLCSERKSVREYIFLNYLIWEYIACGIGTLRLGKRCRGYEKAPSEWQTVRRI